PPPAESDTGPTTVANAAAPGYGVVYTIAPSPRAAGLVWVGTDDGLIHRTGDGGQHCQNVTPQGLTPWSAISLLEASPFDAGVAYAAVDRHRLDDFAPYIYRTRDGGAHWARSDQGIAPQAYVNAVRADPVRAGLLYAGTETGVYVSVDDGDHWQPLQLNLPVASVRDLAVHGRDLIAATHGRSFWILDDLTPLRQLTDSSLGTCATRRRPPSATATASPLSRARERSPSPRGHSCYPASIRCGWASGGKRTRNRCESSWIHEYTSRIPLSPASCGSRSRSGMRWHSRCSTAVFGVLSASCAASGDARSMGRRGDRSRRSST